MIKWRIYVVLGIFLIAVFIIFFRLYVVQIMNHEKYLTRSNLQHTRPNLNVFDRGDIFFQKKNGDLISAAGVKTGYTIAISPRDIKYPEDVFNNIDFYLDIDEDLYINRAYKENDPYEVLARKVSFDVGKKIAGLDLGGVFVEPEKWRYYPGEDLASHTIGFVSYNNSELKGQYGLERSYENVLKRDRSDIFENFFVQMFSSAKDFVENGELGEGSIVTTIEPDVQLFVEQELKNLKLIWQSKQIGAIVMNPKTGAIRAMALSPNFDLNTFNLVDSSAIYTNHLVESVYEMGSIVKPITVAIGLDMDVISPSTKYDDKGSLTLNNYTIYNYDKRARGLVDMQAVLNQSLNTGVAFVVRQTGNKNFADYMAKIFEPKTNIDLPNEANSLLYPNLKSASDIEYVTASYGQGIAMSPISITRALATLGNGGKLVTPHLVEKIKYENGLSKNVKYPESVQIFKPETSEEISRMLVRVVDEALKGGSVAMKNHSIAAKTGTAQIAKRGEVGYYDDRFLHSFFGYFPAYDPEFIVFLYHIEPVGAQYASDTLTEPFMNIAKFLINHYGIPADRDGVVTAQKNN